MGSNHGKISRHSKESLFELTNARESDIYSISITNGTN